jgi:hypothetical protein
MQLAIGAQQMGLAGTLKDIVAKEGCVRRLPVVSLTFLFSERDANMTSYTQSRPTVPWSRPSLAHGGTQGMPFVSFFSICP